ncbi:hypothetical protein [Roseateles asaccharophilus]|uniref:Uncharacterized protein n=1 Tax=Roseateles asaccharophilus TaxID=582607 RepID=A0ABU2ABR2_9BURK|nr:hypothetical protein [Roseateles asaccharophilus]MDR7334555.1 hypothetical protein [Roseateles asaccharophilus]
MAREVDGPAAALVAASVKQHIDGALSLLERWVAVKLGVPRGESVATLSGTTGARARALVAGIAVQVNLCPTAAVAGHFGRARATLSEQMSASRKRQPDQQILGTPTRMILEELKQLA